MEPAWVNSVYVSPTATWRIGLIRVRVRVELVLVGDREWLWFLGLLASELLLKRSRLKKIVAKWSSRWTSAWDDYL